MRFRCLLFVPIATLLLNCGLFGCRSANHRSIVRSPDVPALAEFVDGKNGDLSTVFLEPSGHPEDGTELVESVGVVQVSLSDAESVTGGISRWTDPAEPSNNRMTYADLEKLPTNSDPSGVVDRPLDADAIPLSIDELLQIAVAANPTLQQAYALVQQAEGNWLQVGLYPNPTLEWHDEANNAPFDAHYGLVSQDIVTSKKLKLNRAVASSDIQRARWQAESQNLRVLNEVRLRYVAVLGTQRQVAVARELASISEEGVRSSERFFNAEQVSEADVLQAQLQLNDTQILLQNARFEAAAAWKQLENIVGTPGLSARPVAGRLEDDAAEIDWDTAWKNIVDRNPLLHAARNRAAAADSQTRREAVQPIPNLQVQGGSGRDVLPAGQSFTMYFLKVGATLPVFDQNQGNILAASGEQSSARFEVARLELWLRDQLTDVYQRYQSAQYQANVYRDAILPTAEKNLLLTQKAYGEGELDFLRVLTARRDLFRARINYVTALTDQRSATIELQGLLLTGGLEAIDSNPTRSNSAGQTSDKGN